jgi:uncharacterized protein
VRPEALWKYVNVRRLFIFLERSIYEGTQWVVLEPNDDRLCERVVDSIRLFLRSQWRVRALAGATHNEAVPIRPAEVVILRIFLHTAEAQR